MSPRQYADPVARQRMAAGNCPECGNAAGTHDGPGGRECSRAGYGAATRTAQYQAGSSQQELLGNRGMALQDVPAALEAAGQQAAREGVTSPWWR